MTSSATRPGPTAVAAILVATAISACDRVVPVADEPDASAPIDCNLRCLYRLPYPAEGGLSGYTERVGTEDLFVLWDELPALVTAGGALESLPLQVPYDDYNNGYARIYVHPLGDRVGWLDPESGSFEIRDLDGTLVASASLPEPASEYNGYWPSFAADGERLILEEWHVDLESSSFERLVVTDYAGGVLASVGEEDGLSLDGTQTTRDPESVFQAYAEQGDAGVESGILARRLDDCGEDYRIRGAREWALSDDGRHVFALMDDGALRWFEDGIAKGDAVPTTGAVWNLAVSPSGRFAAASEDSLVLVDEGALVFQIDRPDYYVLTLDVTDRGDVLLGVATEEADGRMLVLDSDGALVAEIGTGVDDNAWHPWVERVFSQDRFFVRDKEAISLLEIVGRDPSATCGVSLFALCADE